MANSHISPIKPEEKSFFGSAKGFVRNLLSSLLPTRKDNINQITVKLLFLLSAMLLITATVYFVGIFCDTEEEMRKRINSPA